MSKRWLLECLLLEQQGPSELHVKRYVGLEHQDGLLIYGSIGFDYFVRSNQDECFGCNCIFCFLRA